MKDSIYVVRHLAFQAISFRGQDDSFSSSNCGNFLETLDIVIFWNEKVVEIIEKDPKNATYTSPRIQNEILYVYSTKVKKAIREEIGDAKFCIMVFRYVDTEGFVKAFFWAYSCC